MFTVNFLVASLCFGCWVSSGYKNSWLGGFFMANLLLGLVNTVTHFVK